jgi:hypothetical protein
MSDGPHTTYAPAAITLVAVTLAALLAATGSAVVLRTAARPAAIPVIHYAPEQAR